MPVAWSFLYGQHLDPVVVGIVDEVEPHFVIFIADPSPFPVVGPDAVVVPCDAHAKVAFVFAELVGLRVVAQPGQLQAERGLPVAQINQDEGAVVGSLAAQFPQPAFLRRSPRAAVEVGDIDVEMVESAFDLHGRMDLMRAKLHKNCEI